MKVEAPELYTSLQEKFSEYKSKFKE